MPLLKVQTNVKLSDAKKEVFAKQASACLANALGKPESYVMVLVEDDAVMVFGGESLPMAFCEVKSIGLSDGQCAPTSAALCELIEEELDISQSKVYIEFANVAGKHWGCNGSTF
jgi:phenylpyruvate tautomerase PptA (4-oxalocrotonate tautomerase family)